MKISKIFVLFVLLMPIQILAGYGDSLSAAKDIANFLEQNGGIVNTKFYPSILKEIQGTYNSTIIFDDTHSEVDTTMQVIVNDSTIETILLETNTKRTEKLSFFCTGTRKSTGNFLYVNYTTNDAFIYFSKTRNDQANLGDYTMVIMYKGKDGPETLNYYIRKVK